MAKVIDSATTIEVKNVVASEAYYREKLGSNSGKFYGEFLVEAPETSGSAQKLTVIIARGSHRIAVRSVAQK